MPKKHYFNEVIFDAQFIIATQSEANAKNILRSRYQPFLPHAFKTHASPSAGMSSVVLRRKLEE